MKKAAALIGLIVVMVFLVGEAGASVQLGVRGGYAHAQGNLFPGSGNIGGNGLYGVAMSVDLMPTVGLEIAWERYQKDFQFSDAAFENTFFGGNGSYEDQAYLVTGKLHLPLGGLFHLYAGGGGGLHRIDLSVKSDDPNVQDYIDHLSDVNQDWEWHVLGGAQFSLPVIPLLVYGEYRFQNVTGGSDVRYNSIYAGLNLILK